MFFLPQTAFVTLDGRQVVRHLYRIEDLPRFARDLEARHDIELDIDTRHNEARLPAPPGLTGLHRLTGAVLRRTIGAGRFARVRSRLRRASGVSPDALYRQLFEDEGLARFVDAHYAEDQGLYTALHRIGFSEGLPSRAFECLVSGRDPSSANGACRPSEGRHNLAR